jgi:hypothetical protein
MRIGKKKSPIEKKIDIEINFRPKNLWIGLFWTDDDFPIYRVYICIFPMLIIRISWWSKTVW